jgi:uncharacterized membrane protein YgaE (UPF0421/DUF939 family)
MAHMRETNEYAGLSTRDLIYAAAMAIACLIAFVMATRALHPFVERDNDLLGGMWAAVAAIFVFRDTRHDSLSAGMARLIATSVSFALCLPYLAIFPFTPIGMAILLGIGSAVMTLLGRRNDIITTGITTSVVLVVAAISPGDAWQQPILRLIDTVIGISVGVSCKWLASFHFGSFMRERPR